ncbi:unnamed protein product [Caretta caretta]
MLTRPGRAPPILTSLYLYLEYTCSALVIQVEHAAVSLDIFGTTLKLLFSGEGEGGHWQPPHLWKEEQGSPDKIAV